MITYVRNSLKETIPYLNMIEDAQVGSLAILKKGKKYLPIEQDEEETSYKSRLEKGTYLDYYNPTIEGISGLIFQSGIKYNDDIQDEVLDFIECATQEKEHFDIVISNLFSSALNKGISFLMFDTPKNSNVKSRREEKLLGISPYAVNIDVKNVTAWKTKTESGKRILTMVKIREFAEEDVADNDYATQSVERYRVLTIGKNELFDERGKLIESVDTNLDFIPFCALNLNKKGFFESFPTFYDLFYLNIAHYQILSDIRHNNHIACVPMLKFIGFYKSEVSKLSISANTAISTENADASVDWIDYDGKGAESSERTLNRIEMKMREIGLSVVSQDKEVTATEIGISTAQSQSKLNVYARNLVDTIETSLNIIARMYGKSEGGTVEIEADILKNPLTAQEVSAISGMVSNGNLSIEGMWNMIKAGKIYAGRDFDIELEKERISSNGLD